MGLELVVEQSDHSLEIGMEQPDTDNRAWDSNLFKSGNLFLKGYANPVKLRVNQQPDLEDPNTAEIEEGTPDDGEEHTDEEKEEEQPQVITSGRYREFMRQNLISQLLTPESHWNILVWALIGVGVLQFMSMIITLWATGSF